jgi:hypothetical protein
MENGRVMSTTTGEEFVTKRFGEYLVELRVLQPADIDEALSRQKRMNTMGLYANIGAILLGMGAIDRESLDAIALRQALDNGTADLGPYGKWPSSSSVRNDSALSQEDVGPACIGETGTRPRTNFLPRSKRKPRLKYHSSRRNR